MKHIDLSTSEDWHRIRAKHVGGSEIAALFGLSPYMTKFQLWHIKAGNLPPEDLSEVERVQAGNFMEPAIAAWASEKWGVRLEKFQGYATHDTIEGFGCTPDYVGRGGKLLVQIKNVDSLQFLREWSGEGDEILEAPMHILLQCQHELAVDDVAEEQWLVVCVGGNRLLRMKIQRRPKTCALIEQAVADFWQSIKDKKEPKPVFEEDAETVVALHAEVAKGKEIDLSSSNRAPEVCANYLKGMALEKEGKTMKDSSKAELLVMMGDADKALVGDIIVKTTKVKDNPGKKITQEMIGMVVGARAGHLRFSVTNTGVNA